MLVRSRASQVLLKGSPYGRAFSTSFRSTKSEHSRKDCRYIFEAHAACKGKRCNQISSNHPSPDSCGEDSFFVTKNVVGIADGVGGWNENNVDPSQISRALMRHACAISLTLDSTTSINFSTREILSYAYSETLLDDQVEAGSTTACILKVKQCKDGNGAVLDYSNLGDSGFVIIRQGKVWYRSVFQAIGLAPFQLAKIPPRFRSYGAMENMPEEANSGEILLEENDIIVLATDGVWDNFSKDLNELPPFFPPLNSWRRYWHGRIEALTDVVGNGENAAERIIQASLNHNLKPDDITVIIATIKKIDP